MANYNKVYSSYSTNPSFPAAVSSQPGKEVPLPPEQWARQPRGTRLLFYILINAAVIFGLLQCVRALVHNLVDLTAIINAYNDVEVTYNTRQKNYQLLNQKINLYASPSGIEELARTRLNKVAEDETPISFQY
jgi:cell division protein FtsB